jgi:hypothetical protein
MGTGKAMKYYREFSESRYFDVGNIVKKDHPRSYTQNHKDVLPIWNK